MRVIKTKTSNMNKIALAVCVLALAFSTSAQHCGAPVPITSVYYQHRPGASFGLGLEAGMQGVDSRLGYYAGVTFVKVPTYSAKPGASPGSFTTNFYAKGTFRLTQPGARGSLFVVASPLVNSKAGTDLQAGLRFMIPIEGKKGIGVEPLYAVRERNLSVNVVLAF